MADNYLLAVGQSGDLNPAQATELENQLRSEGIQFEKSSSVKGTRIVPGFGGAGAPQLDPIAQAQKFLEFQRQANQPAISSLQASLPETEQRFATERTRLGGEKEPLKQRYQNIIDQLTGREKADVALAQQRTGREFGYRGIPASSTLFLDELMRAESPIRQAYGGQIKDVGFERETGLRGIDQLLSQLAGQSVEAKRTIQNAIAQLQSGDPGSALQAAMSILSLQQNQAQFQQSQELQRQKLTQEGTFNERELGLRYAPDPNADLQRQLLQAQIAKQQQVAGGGVVTGGGGRPTEPNPTNRPTGNTFTPNTSQLQTQFGGQRPKYTPLGYSSGVAKTLGY